jgi:hypothetical protein
MGFSQVDVAIRAAVEALVEAGASREAVERHIKPLELAAVTSIVDNQRDQLLLNIDYRTLDLADRFGVDERTIRNWRKSAIDRKSIADMASAKAA